ncbi:MAG TPA: glycosyltransferase [Bryobacteraceae bacterium]|nr:glycosyltransferase [Bryobacteraceae bacterium]
MTILSTVVQLLALWLFGAGVASFAALLKGCFVLRQMTRSGHTYDPAPLLRSPLVPGVSVIAVPPDVSPESREYVQHLLELHFGIYELIVVLDGPSETEMDTWRREFGLGLLTRDAVEDLPTAGVRGIYGSSRPNRLLVVDKKPGGEADALNAGVNQASFPLIALIDRDSEFPPTILLRMVLPMLETPETIAVCGAGLETTPGGLAANLAALESLRLWLVRCAAFAGYDATVPTPGSALLIRHEAILKSGGFRTGPLELVLHLHGLARASGKPSHVVFIPDALRCTRPTRSLKELRSRIARDQMQIGLAWRRRKAIAGGLGAIGWGIPALLATRCLRPLLETAAYVLTAAGWLTGRIDSALAGLILLTTAGMGMVVSMAAVTLRELAQRQGSDPTPLARLFFAAIPENLGYRQVRNLWLLAGLAKVGQASRPVLTQSPVPID